MSINQQQQFCFYKWSLHYLNEKSFQAPMSLKEFHSGFIAIIGLNSLASFSIDSAIILVSTEILKLGHDIASHRQLQKISHSTFLI